MKYIFNTLLAFAFLIIISSSTQAHAYGSYRSSSSFSSGEQGWVIMPQGLYYFNTVTQGTTNVTTNRYVLDGSLGYHFQMLYIGGEYVYDMAQTTQNGSPTSTDTYKAYGGQIGVMSGGLQFLFSYFFGSTATYQGGTSTVKDLTNGSGYQIQLGYLFDVGGSFSVGPEVIYRSLTYTALSNGQAIGNNFTFTTLIPQIGIKYMF